jgi:bilirubin oxidase
MAYYEIPIAIQDRSFNFNADGSLFYPSSRAFFDGYGGPYIPATDVAPFWNPEFFGNMMVVNGRTWPYLTVEKRRYRFRLLNGCNSRFLILRLVTDRPGNPPPRAALPCWQIGAEGGFLPVPVPLEELLIAPAERADVMVDFSNLPVGSEVLLINVGPDEPFGGGTPGADFEPADTGSTGQVMKFIVAPKHGPDRSLEPSRLALPDFRPLPAASATRTLSLNEQMSMSFDGPVAALLGTVNSSGAAVPRLWMDAVTESPAVHATEHWDICNDTEDAHPIHLHLVQFQVIHRRNSDGAIRMPEPWESGYKDTVIAYPDEVTRIRARFDNAGLFVWHCHILEHEDNEMMRPYRVIG